MSKVSALKRTTEVVEHREGGDLSYTRKSPGQTKFEAITLERGVTHDRAFEDVGQQSLVLQHRPRRRDVAVATSARTLSIELLNEAGQVALAYKMFRAGSRSTSALPELDANANAVAIQMHRAPERGLGARHRRVRADRARPRVRP